MTDDPPAALLEAVAAEANRTGMAPGFAEKVAANALGIAERERALGPGATLRAQARLARLLGRDGNERALTDALCAAIGEGALALDDPALVEHLIQCSLDKLAIDQPGYPAFTLLAQAAARR